jgi:hypothetical protein
LQFVPLLLPESLQLLDAFRLLGCEVARFSRVLGEVVQFPRFPFGGDEFPVSDADRAVLFVEPPEGF